MFTLYLIYCNGANLWNMITISSWLLYRDHIKLLLLYLLSMSNYLFVVQYVSVLFYVFILQQTFWFRISQIREAIASSWRPSSTLALRGFITLTIRWEAILSPTITPQTSTQSTWLATKRGNWSFSLLIKRFFVLSSKYIWTSF